MIDLDRRRMMALSSVPREGEGGSNVFIDKDFHKQIKIDNTLQIVD